MIQAQRTRKHVVGTSRLLTVAPSSVLDAFNVLYRKNTTNISVVIAAQSGAKSRLPCTSISEYIFVTHSTNIVVFLWVVIELYI